MLYQTAHEIAQHRHPAEPEARAAVTIISSLHAWLCVSFRQRIVLCVRACVCLSVCVCPTCLG